MAENRRVIFHIDVNSAFLSWEAAYRLRHLGGTLDLRTVPSAVGGDMTKRHGIILAKSIPAKKYHVQTGETLTDALKKCPELLLVPPNYELYEKNSHAFLAILAEYSDRIEKFSVDEAFVDMTGTEALFGPPVVAAHAIKDRIYRELGFTVNVGVSSNKLLAKMASDFEKPNRVHTLFPEEIPDKLWNLPVGDLYLVGRATRRKLFTLGIHTIGELAGTDLELLRAHLKSHGEMIWNFANGRDVSPVEVEEASNKGYGNSTTTAFDVCDRVTAHKVLLSLAETVGWRLRRDHVEISQVSVGLRYYDLSSQSHQGLLRTATHSTREIYEKAAELFDELWQGTPIRLLSIQTGRVSGEEEYQQISLWDQKEREKQERWERAVEAIRARFGADSIMRASFLQGPGKPYIDHMGGGISREKRTVDYEKGKVM